ncbi:transposase family protein [Mycobacterium sp. MAC_011194_8550]|nr:transposase family protein [Mycobacterium sp. MAC_011194_8550]
MRATAGLIATTGPDRLAGVTVIGVDEHRWAPRRRGTEGFVTLIIDLTPTHDQTGPARLLDLVEGRSATALATWLAAQPTDFARAVEVIAMDGFAGYKTAATEVIPDAVTVMDPFHVVALAGTKLDLIRQRIQQQTLGRRGHTGDPLYGIRRIARTRLQLLSPRQYTRLTEVLDGDDHLAVKVAWLIYQKIIAAYADPNRRHGKKAMTRLIESIRRGVPAGLEEIAQLGRTLSRRRADILAFFDHHVSNGPTEAINGRLEVGAAYPPDWRRSPNSAARYRAAAPTSWPSSTTTSPTDPPRPSTAAWKSARRTRRIGGDRPTRPHAIAPPRRHPGLLRPPRLQRTHRGHQRPPGSIAPQRPRIPQPHPLPLALTTTQRSTPPTCQCTLNYEEPSNPSATALAATASAAASTTSP